jgi:hypothetical protein
LRRSIIVPSNITSTSQNPVYFAVLGAPLPPPSLRPIDSTKLKNSVLLNHVAKTWYARPELQSIYATFLKILHTPHCRLSYSYQAFMHIYIFSIEDSRILYSLLLYFILQWSRILFNGKFSKENVNTYSRLHRRIFITYRVIDSSTVPKNTLQRLAKERTGVRRSDTSAKEQSR